MNIRKIRNILKRDHEVSLQYLAMEAGESAEDIKYILEDWEARGRVKFVEEIPGCIGACSGCSAVSSCGSAGQKRYRWV